ncbi:hypothetical protein L1987_88043 [Smallanthus sonchifolius]|nr:hypothetical protein L1987_88043 [Smallanthus sonchifolius]
MLRREEELQLQKLKKRKIKANPRLSFSEDVENGEEEDGEDKNTEPILPYFARSQSDSDSDADDERVAETVKEGGDVGDDVHKFGGGNFNPALGVETLCAFPKNPAKCTAVVCLFIRFTF